MKFSRTVLFFAILVLVAGFGLASHHLNGSWSVSVELSDGQGGAAKVTLNEGEGGALTGRYEGALGQHDLTGKVSGSEVEFGFEAAEIGKVSYQGKVDGNSMSGTCVYGPLGGGTFKAEKLAE